MASSNWSDGAMWMRVLEAGESRTRRATIFNMLGYMGAWEWYDRQVKLVEGVVYTRRNGPVDHRGAAIHVMNKIQGKSVAELLLKKARTNPIFLRKAQPSRPDLPKGSIFACSLLGAKN
jgi:hypothetical protein